MVAPHEVVAHLVVPLLNNSKIKYDITSELTKKTISTYNFRRGTLIYNISFFRGSFLIYMYRNLKSILSFLPKFIHAGQKLVSELSPTLHQGEHSLSVRD